jgi:hypothetical protein
MLLQVEYVRYKIGLGHEVPKLCFEMLRLYWVTYTCAVFVNNFVRQSQMIFSMMANVQRVCVAKLIPEDVKKTLRFILMGNISGI